MLLWGLRNTQAVSKQIQQLFLTGRLKYGGSEIKKLLGEKNEERGKIFRENIKKLFKSFEGLEVCEYEVKVSPRGHLKSDKDLGDIDLLVYDRVKSIVYCIECKRTHQSKNIHEMKSELDRYLGREGQTKNIEKHLRRHEWLEKNKNILAAFIKAEGAIEIKSFIVASDVIPITYLAAGELPLPIIAYPELKRNGIALIDKTGNNKL